MRVELSETTRHISDEIARLVKIERAAMKFLSTRGHSWNCSYPKDSTVGGECSCGLIELEEALGMNVAENSLKLVQESIDRLRSVLIEKLNGIGKPE